MLEEAGDRAQLVLCTCPDEQEAGRLARLIVEQRLAACVNVLPGIRSIYRWKDALVEEPEALMIIKTTPEGCPALERFLRAQHPYEVPEMLSVAVDRGSGDYLAWLEGQVA